MKRLGVIGTMVWDTIHGRDTRSAPFEEWGGIAYALSAFEAALPADWALVPLVKVGADLGEQADAFLAGLTHRAAAARFLKVPEPNNRVTLRYASLTRRSERLTGGVPPWRWEELGPLVADCDAVYLNFIAGFELDLDTAERLRAGFDGPIYADLHSLLLGVRAGGERVPQPLSDPDRWLACFDVVQANEEELRLMADDPMALAARALAAGVSLLVITLGPDGAAYFTHPPFRLGRPAPAAAPIETRRIPAALAHETGDTTGCGDVFGATLLAHLLADGPLDRALVAANRAAARNVTHHGATSLHYHLRGEIAPA